MRTWEGNTGIIDLTEARGWVLAVYRHLTGFDETNMNAVFHHRIALYGPSCKRCSVPLRTPKARFCAACGERVGSTENCA
jgi:hypothetical protein